MGGVVLRPYVLLPLWMLALVLSRSTAVFFAGRVAALVVQLWLRVRIRPAEVFADEGGLVLYAPGVLSRAATVPWPEVAHAQQVRTFDAWAREPVGHRVLVPGAPRPNLVVTFRGPFPLPGRQSNRLDVRMAGRRHRWP